MARNITLTLGVGLGADLGPNFNLTANVGSVTPSTATKTELTAGKSVSVDDAATQVTVTSTGTCTNAITQTIPCAVTTTTTTTTEPPTTTTTTTAALTCNYYTIEGAPSIDVEWLECDGTPNSDTVTTAITICAQTDSPYQTGGAGNITELGACSSPTTTTTTTTAATATLNWSFNEYFGANGIYDLYINSVSVETRNSTASGTYTVSVGDVISVGCNADQCTGGGSTHTNIVVTGEITDAACQNNGSIPSFVSVGYTVVSGDIGTNLYVTLDVSCDGSCV